MACSNNPPAEKYELPMIYMTIDVVWGCEWEEMEEGVGGQWEGLGGQAHLSWESSDMPG